MEMTKDDIRLSWEVAADRTKQIKILADLNLVSEETIIDILREQGVDQRKLPRNRAPKHKDIAPRVQEYSAPRIKPRHLHDAERMRDLFHAIGEMMLQNKKPTKEWVDEFNALWAAYLKRADRGDAE